MRVMEIMTSDPVCCTLGTGLQDVGRMMVECACGAIPVVDAMHTMKPIGIVTDRDIVCRAVADGKNPLELTVADVMTPRVTTVTPETSFDVCCQMMEQDQVRRLVVVDENGACCGIVSLADIARTKMVQETAEVVEKVSQPFGIPSRPAVSA